MIHVCSKPRLLKFLCQKLSFIAVHGAVYIELKMATFAHLPALLYSGRGRFAP